MASVVAVHDPLFVVGTQRSGTTLLCRMLSAHPDIFIQNELNVRQIFPGRERTDQIVQAIKELIEDDQGESLESILGRTNKSIWGLKDPELTAHLDGLEKFIPGSKIIVIIRDPRAVVNSYMENKWGLGTNAYTGALRWQAEVRAQLEFARKHPESVLVIKYECLVEQQENELRRIFKFLQVPFHPDVMNYHEKPTYYHRTRENATTFSAPRPEIMAKWISKLSLREKRIIDWVCADTMRCLGYRLGADPRAPGELEKRWYLLHQRVLGEIQIQYRWRSSVVREYFRKRRLRDGKVAAL